MFYVQHATQTATLKPGLSFRDNYVLNYFRIALDLLLQAVGMNTFFLSISEIVFTAVYVIIFLVIFPTYRTCYHMSMVRISFWFFLYVLQVTDILSNFEAMTRFQFLSPNSRLLFFQVLCTLSIKELII